MHTPAAPSASDSLFPTAPAYTNDTNSIETGVLGGVTDTAGKTVSGATDTAGNAGLFTPFRIPFLSSQLLIHCSWRSREYTRRCDQGPHRYSGRHGQGRRKHRLRHHVRRRRYRERGNGCREAGCAEPIGPQLDRSIKTVGKDMRRKHVFVHHMAYIAGKMGLRIYDIW